jgi:arsenate reductase (thioredoxin)
MRLARRLFAKQLQALTLILGAIAALSVPAAAGERAETTTQTATTQATIVFVCEHGSAKSLVAAELFNRLARERGVPARALSRAVSAQTVDPKVPAALARNMSGDGFDVGGFQPQPLSAGEAKNATRVVVVNYDDEVAAAAGATTIEHWNIGPAVTLEYQKARDEIAARIGALVDSLGRDAKAR